MLGTQTQKENVGVENPSMSKDILYSYMAGFVDADGSISIASVSKKKRFTAKLNVSNCKEEIIKLFKDEFGGKIRVRNWENKRWRPCFWWDITHKRATAALKELLPYLKIKKKQAELAIKMDFLHDEMKKHGRWHPEVKTHIEDEMIKLKEECVLLNKRGI